MPRPAIHSSAAARQAAYKERLRGLTPLQRITRLAEADQYTEEERQLLADFRRAQEILEDRAARLNRLVTGRLNLLEAGGETKEIRRSTAALLKELETVWRITLPAF